MDPYHSSRMYKQSQCRLKRDRNGEIAIGKLRKFDLIFPATIVMSHDDGKEKFQHLKFHVVHKSDNILIINFLSFHQRFSVANEPCDRRKWLWII